MDGALNAWLHAGIGSDSDRMQALVEGYQWLQRHGLIASGPFAPYNGVITRLGRAVLNDGPRVLHALELLSAELHPAIAKVRSQFYLGEYELGAFAAMKAVEVRVREVGGFSDSDFGVHLMREAFRPDSEKAKPMGPLTDESAESGERQGLSNLFAGAVAVFKNPSSHRNVSFDDPVEAAEIVNFASLLLRIVDRRSHR
ncbi:MAG: TIGR02391 family protein [Actinomycetota bacterium]